MILGTKLAISAVAVAAAAFVFVAAGEAAPLAPASSAKTLGHQALDDWQLVEAPGRHSGTGLRDGSRRGGRPVGRSHRHGGDAAGAAAAIGIIGGVMGAIAADAAARQHQDAVRACMRRYGRAYDPASEMVYTRRGAFPCP